MEKSVSQRASGTKTPDRSCRWGDWGMGEIFDFALMRRRVRHGALTMRLRSHVRSAVKTASWRAFAAVDTFGLVWLFSGHDTTHAIAAAGDNGASQPQKIRPGQAEPGRSGAVRTSADAIAAALAPTGRTPRIAAGALSEPGTQ